MDDSRINTLFAIMFLEQLLDPPIIDKPYNHLAVFINDSKVRVPDLGVFPLFLTLIHTTIYPLRIAFFERDALYEMITQVK